MRIAGLTLAVAVVSCGPYPRDIDGTRDRVEATHVIRTGLVAGTDTAVIRPFIVRLEGETHASARVASGTTEHLLARLEAGDLDLVLGPFAKDSPWRDDVAILDPLNSIRTNERDIGVTPVARNGENRWIMLLKRAAR